VSNTVQKVGGGARENIVSSLEKTSWGVKKGGRDNIIHNKISKEIVALGRGGWAQN